MILISIPLRMLMANQHPWQCHEDRYEVISTTLRVLVTTLSMATTINIKNMNRMTTILTIVIIVIIAITTIIVVDIDVIGTT